MSLIDELNQIRKEKDLISSLSKLKTLSEDHEQLRILRFSMEGLSLSGIHGLIRGVEPNTPGSIPISHEIRSLLEKEACKAVRAKLSEIAAQEMLRLEKEKQLIVSKFKDNERD